MRELIRTVLKRVVTNKSPDRSIFTLTSHLYLKFLLLELTKLTTHFRYGLYVLLSLQHREHPRDSIKADFGMIPVAFTFGGYPEEAPVTHSSGAGEG